MTKERLAFRRVMDYTLPVDPAAYGLTMLPGRVAVAMDPPFVESRGILIPRTCLDARGRARPFPMRPDSGTVIASGVDELPIGTRVVCAPSVGAYLDDWVRPPVDDDGERVYHWVRMFGLKIPLTEIEKTQGVRYLDAWHDSIEAVLN